MTAENQSGPTCEYCHEPRPASRTKFCSNSCGNKSFKARWRKEHGESYNIAYARAIQPRVVLETRNCCDCEAPFKIRPLKQNSNVRRCINCSYPIYVEQVRAGKRQPVRVGFIQ